MEKFVVLHDNQNENIYFGPLNFKYLEYMFGIFTMTAVLPQVWKIASTRKAKDFSMGFITGMIIINLLFFMVGFINNIKGLMLGSAFFTFYNLVVVYFYFFGVQGY
jgi:uncharacterized protein with PQ loop repeat